MPLSANACNLHRAFCLLIKFQALTGLALAPFVPTLLPKRNQSRANCPHDASPVEAQPVAVTASMDNLLETTPLQFKFSVATLAPGEYVCQMTLLSPGDKKVAFWRTAVMITP